RSQLSYPERVRERVHPMPQATATVLVSELYPDRYGVGRTKLYEFLKRLNIAPFKPEGDKRGHITLDQLSALDTYTKTLDEQGPEAAQTYADSQAAHSPQADELAPVNASVNPSAQPALPPAMELIVEAIAARLQPQAAPDIFAPQRQLKEAAEENWQLTTAQLKAILSGQPKDGAVRYGFALIKVSRGWWRVEAEA
ncbi:MAG: hypothetical protein ACR2FS_05565, partial [Phormidesmis sp.]